MYNRLAKMKKKRNKPIRISFSKRGEVLVSWVQRIKYGIILSIGPKKNDGKYFQK